MTTKTRRITMERFFRAPMEDVWDLWTTKEGIESWWGPEGFRVEVRMLDLRVGGQLLYDMIAANPETIAFMKEAGMPTSHPASITFTEVTPHRRLAYDHAADFIPGVASYNVATLVELFDDPKGVRMVLSFDAMHNDEWTERASMGWASELGKLEKLINSPDLNLTR
jgi:uncharacterized protein YndB with AHSA1/START domain